MSRLSRHLAADTVTDAIALLKHDHRLIEASFKEFEAAGDQQLDPLARRICKILRVHMQIEEDLFYPVARAAVPDPALVDEIAAQHGPAEQSIMLIEAVTSAHPAFLTSIAALRACVCSHLEAEERILFPLIAASSVNLVALGLALIERRDILMRALGLSDDDDIPALRQLTAIESAPRRRQLPAGDPGHDAVRGPGQQDARRYRER